MTHHTAEIVYDSYDDACAWNLRLHEDIRILDPSWPWLEALQRRNSRICVVEHRGVGRLIVGAWVYAPGEATVPVLQELMAFDGRGDGWAGEGLPPWNVLQNMLKPSHEKLSEAEAARRAEAYARRRQLELNRDSKEDAKKHLRHRGMGHEARMLDYSPWHVPDPDAAAHAKSTGDFIHGVT